MIQERLYDRHHELGMHLASIPDDDFFNNYPIGGSYSYHFDEKYSWEVVRAQWVVSKEKDLKKDLLEEFGAEPSKFDQMEYVVQTSFVFKPAYGKDSLLNKGIINHEAFLSFGGGIVQYEREYDYGDSTNEKAWSIGFGVGRKYFLSRQLNLNLELRELVVFKDDGTENNIYLGVGIAYRFDLEARKSRQLKETESIYRYLKDEHE